MHTEKCKGQLPEMHSTTTKELEADGGFLVGQDAAFMTQGPYAHAECHIIVMEVLIELKFLSQGVRSRGRIFEFF